MNDESTDRLLVRIEVEVAALRRDVAELKDLLKLKEDHRAEALDLRFRKLLPVR